VPASIRASALLLTASFLLSGCTGDDEAAVTAPESAPAVSSAPASSAGTASATPTAPSEEDLAEIVDAYRGFLAGEVDDMIAATEDLSAAIKRGSPVQARARYPESRQGWNTVRVFAEKVDGLIGKVDATWTPPGDIEAASKEWNSQFEAAMWAPGTAAAEGAGDGGWGRIEWSIFADKTIKYLSPVGDDLLRNLEELRTRLPDLEITPAGMAAEAVKLQALADANISGTAERYSDADVSAMAGNVTAIRRIVELLAPVLDARSPGLTGELRDVLDELDTALVHLENPEGGGYVKRDENLTEDQRAAIASAAAAVDDLAEPLGRLGSAVG
jgi:iron uptake system component EfeO